MVFIRVIRTPLAGALFVLSAILLLDALGLARATTGDSIEESRNRAGRDALVASTRTPTGG